MSAELLQDVYRRRVLPVLADHIGEWTENLMHREIVADLYGDPDHPITTDAQWRALFNRALSLGLWAGLAVRDMLWPEREIPR